MPQVLGRRRPHGRFNQGWGRRGFERYRLRLLKKEPTQKFRRISGCSSYEDSTTYKLKFDSNHLGKSFSTPTPDSNSCRACPSYFFLLWRASVLSNPALINRMTHTSATATRRMCPTKLRFVPPQDSRVAYGLLRCHYRRSAATSDLSEIACGCLTTIGACSGS